MELRQLQYFLVVAGELHFGRAAERLHIVQSAVSQQVNRLERELGVTLFERTTRTVRLTEAGRRLQPHAEQVLNAVTQARQAVEDLRIERTGTIRLGTSTGLGTRLEKLLVEFARLAPDAHLELANADADERIKRVRSGELDAAVLRGPRDESDLELLPLWSDALVAAIPARHDLAVLREIDLARLAELPLRLVARSHNPALYDLVIGCCRQAGFEPVLGPEFTTDQDTLAAVGFGQPSWTVYYATMAVRLTFPGVVFRPLRNPEPVMPSFLAVRPNPPRAELRALLSACHAIDS
ncbi:LysR family transcriptional regulator [Nocardia panacis]|uniref:LysR family transcriptional regulator n=1 Tax=Nocardia panacis TaxID=2340916 RepID=A0A3A4K2G3_9NOCA|nr:LysR family transcriptional regulator [Nocardia panacis]RJO70624.1 LysR family transcriptional regulator [Nocardia panacis]